MNPMRLVRGGQWWYPMVGPLVALACLEILLRSVPVGDGVPRLLGLLWSVAALAAYGHIVNDAGDVDVDRRAGTPNALDRLPAPARVGLAVVAAVAGALPWFVVHLDAAATVLLGVVFALPLVYSLRPLRAKERGFIGVVADAANAHLVPSLFVLALFAGVGRSRVPEAAVVAAVAVWASAFGIRAILVHQIRELDRDRRAIVQTFVVRRGTRSAARVAMVALVGEFISLVGLAAITAAASAAALAVLVVHGALFHLTRRRRGLALLSQVPAPNGYTSLLEWYEVWPAVTLAAATIVVDWRYVGLAVATLVLFAGGVRKQGRDLASVVRELAGRPPVRSAQ